MNLPKARTSELLEQESGSELLVYDLRIDKAYNLNETSKIVFNACGKQMSFDELKRRHKFTDDLIYFALDELKASNLIEGEVLNNFSGLNRREIIRRVGLASMTMLPVVIGVTAPRASQAASLLPLQASCTQASQCASRNCGGSFNNPNVGACCQRTRQSCQQSADCCRNGDAPSCENGTCCSNLNTLCLSQADCCSGLTCSGRGFCERI